MRYVYGEHFDGGAWPGPLSDCDAVAGERWGGPSGLLSTLEGQLGLSGRRATLEVRAAELMDRLDIGDAFWRASAEADPFATAIRLIRWYDWLRWHGWRGQPVSPRLGQLADLMSTASLGPAERWEGVEAAISEFESPIDAIELIACEVDGLPCLIRKTLEALDRAGCPVLPRDIEPAEPTGDLAGCLTKGYMPAGTGELQLIRPSGPLEAAEQVAVWLSGTNDQEGTVVIGADPVLDEALRRHGLPRLGTEDAPGSAPLQQILPVIVALTTPRQDPLDALELLTLPETPVPRGLSWWLDRALREWPSCESRCWAESFEKGLGKIEDKERRDAVARRVSPLFETSGSIERVTRDELFGKLAVLASWLEARRRAEESGSTRWANAARLAASFRAVCESTGLTAFDRPVLARLLSRSLSAAPAPTRSSAEAGLSFVSHPGAVAGPATRIVWWAFNEGAVRREWRPGLTAGERCALEAIDAAAPDPGTEATRLCASWRAPVRMARQSLLLVCPQLGEDGEALEPHPLWDEITAGLDGSALARITSSEPTGLTRARRVEALEIPTPRTVWSVSAGSVELPERWSPSSINALLANPLHWVLERVAGLTSGRADGLDDGVLLKGKVAHEILGGLLTRRSEGERLDSEEAATDAKRVFLEDAPRLAGALFLPGREAERDELARLIADAARDLFRHLDEWGESVEAVEEWMEADADGLALKGRPDLVLGNTVLDLKWGRLDDRRAEMERGGASQLAVYTRLIRAPRPIGYYIISKRRCVVLNDQREGAEVVAGPTVREVWGGVRSALTERIGELQRGHILDTCADVEGHTTREPTALEGGVLRVAPNPAYAAVGWVSEQGGQA